MLVKGEDTAESDRGGVLNSESGGVAVRRKRGRESKLGEHDAFIGKTQEGVQLRTDGY